MSRRHSRAWHLAHDEALAAHMAKLQALRAELSRQSTTGIVVDLETGSFDRIADDKHTRRQARRGSFLQTGDLD